MLINTFTVTILNHHWIRGEADDRNDLCSHGFVFAQIGDEIICDRDTLDVTTSAASLHLLRTLTKDYIPNNFSWHLLPCCGHFIIASDDLNTADVYGCNSGVDWEVKHTDDGYITLTSLNGTVATVTFQHYKSQVLAFADTVRFFYSNSSKKILPDDDFDRNGYIAFWNEWISLRNKWT